MSPTCPRCGDLCAAGDERCECGARLYLAPRTRVAAPRKQAARRHTVSCACGCGATFLNTDPQGRHRRYVRGHSLNQKPVPPPSKAVEWWATRFTAAELRELSAGLM